LVCVSTIPAEKSTQLGGRRRGRWFPCRFTVDLDGSSTVLDYPVDHTQSHTGPFIRFLGGEKRVEDLVHYGRMYTVAGVTDGQPNPVISKVLKGETYRGRAFVVNAWYITIYKPFYDENGQLIGMLFDGVKEQEGNRLGSVIANTKIGPSGYTFVMDSKGAIVSHPKTEMVGKDAGADLQVSDIHKILKQKEPGETKAFSYTVEKRRRLLP
jgi:hypothetical protein